MREHSSWASVAVLASPSVLGLLFDLVALAVTAAKHAARSCAVQELVVVVVALRLPAAARCQTVDMGRLR